GRVDLARIAQDVVYLAARSGRGSDVDLVYEGPNALEVTADAGQLRQVLWNLVRNAIQVSSPGAKVTVRVEDRGDSPLLEISDHGPGIPSEVQSQIFDAFFTTRPAGIGIGL